MNKFATYLRTLLILVVLHLFCASCQDDDPVPNDEIINLKVLNGANEEITQTIGDGETIITLEVTVPSTVADGYKTVTFKKSGGQFMGSPDASVVKPIDNDGKARVNLKVPLGNEPLMLSAEIGSSSSKIFIDEEVVSLIGVDQIVQLSALDAQGQVLSGPIKADGSTVLLLKAKVLTNTAAFNQIVFNASNGVFQSNNSLQTTKAINSQHEAIVSYKVPKDVGPLFFSATAGANSQYFDELGITLERAYANAMAIEPAVITMDTSQGNTLKVYLTRNVGSVSIGTPATFQAFQVIDGAEVNVGRFTGLATAATDANGEVTVTFYADTNNITEDVPITIRVKTLTDSGGEITQGIDLTVDDE